MTTPSDKSYLSFHVNVSTEVIYCSHTENIHMCEFQPFQCQRKKSLKTKHDLLFSFRKTGSGTVLFSASLQLTQYVKGHVRQCTDTSSNMVHYHQLSSGYLVLSTGRRKVYILFESLSYKFK